MTSISQAETSAVDAVRRVPMAVEAFDVWRKSSLAFMDPGIPIDPAIKQQIAESIRPHRVHASCNSVKINIDGWYVVVDVTVASCKGEKIRARSAVNGDMIFKCYKPGVSRRGAWTMHTITFYNWKPITYWFTDANDPHSADLADIFENPKPWSQASGWAAAAGTIEESLAMVRSTAKVLGSYCDPVVRAEIDRCIAVYLN